MRITRLAVASTVVVALPSLALAQKKALTQADWDTWKSISSPALSNDGKWAAYTLIPQVGDGELVIRATTGNTEYRVPRGYLGRPNNTPGGLRGPAGGTGEEAPTGPNATPAQFTADSKFVIVATQASQGGSGARGTRSRRQCGEPAERRDRQSGRRQGDDRRRRAFVPVGEGQRNMGRVQRDAGQRGR